MQLPIDSSIPDILRKLRESNNLVIEAPPGAGKTTRVPPALLDLDPREVLVLEPRRLAARLAARFVAGERGEPVGETVGYQVRFEEVAGPRTRLRFVTEGVLTRRLLSDPTLRRRCLRRARRISRAASGRRSRARVAAPIATDRAPRSCGCVVMSATLDAAPVARFLGGAPVLRSEGRQYPLEIEYTPHSAAPLEEQVRAALERLARAASLATCWSSCPEPAEIRRAQTRLRRARRAATDGSSLPLHGDQSPEEQDRAVAPSPQPQDHSCHQCRRKLHHHRRRDRRDR